MSKAILTLPMMPVDGTNYGKYVTPIISETLKNILDAKYYHCVNLLDSFNDRQINLKEYIDSLDDNGIKYDSLWYDKDYINLLLNNINKLIKKGYIYELNTQIYRCDCGIVEIEKCKIPSCNPENMKFEYMQDKMYCKICGSECKIEPTKVLAFTPFGIKCEQLDFLPFYLNKDIKTYDNTVINSYTTISRNRNTGITMNYNGTKYNIDIDFLWATYLASFPEKEKIVVSGNRMVYQLFLVGAIEKCLEPTNNTVLLGTPYITDIKKITDSEYFINNEIVRKLSVLFNLKWNKKEKNYDYTILKYLKDMQREKLLQLYDIINRKVTLTDSFYNDVNNVIKKQFNMQECIKTLKIERR